MFDMSYSDTFTGSSEDLIFSPKMVNIETPVCLSCVRARCKGCLFAEDREEQNEDFS
jgi:hypothetical protein